MKFNLKIWGYRRPSILISETFQPLFLKKSQFISTFNSVNNQQDIQLLQNHPSKLIIKYQSVVEKILDRYIQQGKLPNHNRTKLLQIIAEQTPNRLLKLWEKADKKAYVLTLLAQATKVVCKNLIDLHLLQNQHPQLIVNYRSLIDRKVNYFVNEGFVKEADARDVFQTVQQKLLEKLQNGRLQQYQGTEDTLFATYIHAIIHNQIKDICKSLYQTQKRQAKEKIQTNHVQASPIFEAIVHDFSFEEQLKMFAFLIQQYVGKEKIKLEVCFKTNYRLLLKEKDIQPLALPQNLFEKMLSFFSLQYLQWSSKQLWESLAEFINHFEAKNNTTSNLRKWFTRKRNHFIIKILLIVIHQKNTQIPSEWIGREKEMLQQVTANRDLVKLLDEWMGELIYRYYKS